MAALGAAEIHQRLRAKLGDAVGDLDDRGRNSSCTVPPEKLLDAVDFLKNDPDLYFDCLQNLSGVDYPKRNVIQVVYHLFSYRHRHLFVLKVDASRDDAKVPTVSARWRTADWLEREVFDLLGVDFTGHPDMRRIMMPEDWPGHPLRKDFVEPEEYHGIATSRESLLKV